MPLLFIISLQLRDFQFNVLLLLLFFKRNLLKLFLLSPQVDAGLKADCDSDRQAATERDHVCLCCADTWLLIRCVSTV